MITPIFYRFETVVLPFPFRLDQLGHITEKDVQIGISALTLSPTFKSLT